MHYIMQSQLQGNIRAADVWPNLEQSSHISSEAMIQLALWAQHLSCGNWLLLHKKPHSLQHEPAIARSVADFAYCSLQ